MKLYTRVKQFCNNSQISNSVFYLTLKLNSEESFHSMNNTQEQLRMRFVKKGFKPGNHLTSDLSESHFMDISIGDKCRHPIFAFILITDALGYLVWT